MDKNKIVFIGIVGLLVCFIIGYILWMTQKSETEPSLEQPDLPELHDVEKEYGSKLEAVDALEEERKLQVPGLYDESKLDSIGIFDPMARENERQRIVDSIYRHGRINYNEGGYRKPKKVSVYKVDTIAPDKPKSIPKPKTKHINLAQAHQGFFEAHSKHSKVGAIPFSIPAVVNGEQTVRAKGRLELRLREAVELNGRHFKRNTLLYGFVSFTTNRVYVAIDHIGQHPIHLKAYDLLDGGEGIYVENSYREDAQREVLDDAFQDVNIPGLPQVGGIKQVFRRSNRTVRVTIHDQYQLLLKP